MGFSNIIQLSRNILVKRESCRVRLHCVFCEHASKHPIDCISFLWPFGGCDLWLQISLRRVWMPQQTNATTSWFTVMEDLIVPMVTSSIFHKWLWQEVKRVQSFLVFLFSSSFNQLHWFCVFAHREDTQERLLNKRKTDTRIGGKGRGIVKHDSKTGRAIGEKNSLDSGEGREKRSASGWFKWCIFLI